MIHNISRFIAALALLATAQGVWATETSTITVNETDYTLFTGFTATDGNGRNYAKLVDGNTSTDWSATKNYDDPNAPANDFNGGTADPAFVEFHADEPFVPKGYVLTCDHVNAGFWKPVEWALKAKLNEGDEWTTIQSSTTTLGQGKTFEIACDNDGDNEYQYFRFEVYEVGTTMTVDLDELQFYGLLPTYTHLTVKAATCMATGIKVDCYRRNSDGKYFTDNTGETEIPESDVIAPMIPHTGVRNDATDTHIAYWQCSVCSKYFSDEGCTTEITKEQTKIYRTITIDGSISGLVRVYFGYTQALAGETIALFVSDLIDASTLKVNDGAVELTAKTDIQYTFTMPAADVTVTADVAQSNADGDVLTGSIRHTVTIPDGASITLNNATITGSIVCEGSATITLVGTNSVSGATNKAGIQIGGSGTTLTINGDGTLTANGGDNSAGIGLSRAWNVTEDVVGGNIVINGGNITANGGGGGAGIGAGVTKDPNNSSSRKAIVGTITIAGGSVTAVGGSNADGIGAGENNYNATIQIGTVTIYDGIDKVDASSIKDFASVVYMHGETNVTASKTDYFAIGEDGDRRLIAQKPAIAEIADQTYTGSEITPEPQVTIGSLSLTKSTDYVYSYTNNTNVGTATVTVTFQGNYESLGSVEKTFTIVWSETDTDEYTIHNAAEWNVFCDCLNDNDTYNRFSGKTVKLGDNITVSRMAGSSKHDFCGTFDGDGHTLTFNHGTSDSYASDEYTAPFCYVSTVTPTGGTEVPTNFRNLHVAGDIYTTAKYAAGLIARQWGTVNVVNCRSSIVVHSNVTNNENDGNDGTHGGFVSVQQNGTLSFTGCTFDGKLLTNANNVTTRCGGFVGYRSGGTTNITNCLYAPADLADGETEVVDGNSATFVRNGAPTVTNCYYTRALGTAQGKAPRTVTAGADVTIEAVEITSGAEWYNVSGILAYSSGGLYRDATLYYGSGDQLSLTLSNTATAAPLGYQYGYTASAGTLSGTTLTMADADATIGIDTSQPHSTRQTVTLSYVTADGTPAQTDQAVALDGSETSLGTYGQEKWYFVGTDISHTGTITCYGDVHIILCDGKTMTVDGNGSYALWSPFGNFYFYGQSGQTGTLNTTGRIDAADNNAGTLTINGGIINASGDYGITAYDLIINRGTVEATGNDGHGIWSGGNITINGGNVNATATDANNGIYGKNIAINGGNVNATGSYGSGINANYGSGTITLGWTKPTDRITASSYSGTVQVADGKKLHNGSSFLDGILSDPATALNGKTLRPAATATYTTADGTTATADAILLDASDNSLPAGNYLATGTLNYTHGITLNGNVTLILADNCEMNIGSSEGRVSGEGLCPSVLDANLIIYGQSTDPATMGSLGVYVAGGHNFGITGKAITINGGNITADTNGNGARALFAGDGDITINGGNVTVNATGTDAPAIYASGNFNYNGGNVTATAPNGTAIYANGNYTFSWRTPADRITIGATGLYAPDDNYTATFARLFTDGTTTYSTTLTGDELNVLAGKTLQPCAAVTFAPEGYATYYDSQYDVTLPAGVKARIVTANDGGTLTYATIADGDDNTNNTVPAGTAVMLQTAPADAAQTKPLLIAARSAAYAGDNLLHGSDDATTTTGDGKHYKLSYNTSGTDLGWYWGVADGAPFTTAAHKAWLVLPNGTNARSFALPDFGETTTLIDNGQWTIDNEAGAWFTINGVKLSGKPTKAGLYIVNGKKVMIK